MSAENREHGESLIRKLFVCHAAFDPFHHRARDSESHAPAFTAGVLIADGLHAGLIREETLHGVCGVFPKGCNLRDSECLLLPVVHERLILRGLSFSRSRWSLDSPVNGETGLHPPQIFVLHGLDYKPGMADGLVESLGFFFPPAMAV